MQSIKKQHTYHFMELRRQDLRTVFPLYEQKQVIEVLPMLISRLEEHYQALTATNPQLSRLLEYLERNYTEKIYLQEVCQHMCMTGRTLTRFLNKETGRSFMALLQQIRVRHAVELLETTTESITAIGYSVGFESTKAFCQVFKREMGVTPGKFRSLK